MGHFMNRIDKKFKELKKENKTASVVYVTAGDPFLAVTKKIVFKLEDSGADIIELGVPFSDPLADGPTIQAASARALKNKTSLKGIISLVRELRKKTDIPLVFMMYYNSIFRFGVEKFVRAAKSSGVDGVIVPDLPPEEAGDLINISKKSGFATIFLLAPTSTKKRMQLISKHSTGFIYYVSSTGVTGVRKKLPVEIKGHIGQIKKITNKPVCIGFGISSPKQAKAMAELSDGVIVGSAVVKIIEKNLNKKDLVEKVGRFVKGLSNAVHNK